MNRVFEVIGRLVGFVAMGLEELWSHWTFWRQEIDDRSFRSAMGVYFALVGIPVILLSLMFLVSVTNPAEQPPVIPDSEKDRLLDSAKDVADYAKPLLLGLLAIFLASVRLTIGFFGCLIRRARFAE